MTCPECGAHFADANDSCGARFDQLLALDHSRQEPWGSRHGLAFAVFALQHPGRFNQQTVARAHELLTRVVAQREPLGDVVKDFRARPASDAHQSAYETTEIAAGRTPYSPFAVTIADLGDFTAEHYADLLDAWCRATLDAIAVL